MLRRRGYFGKGHPFVAPGDDVAGVGDVDLCVISSAFNNPRFVNFEKFRVQSATVQLEGQFGNFGSDS